MLEREDIYQRVWGYAMARGDRSVDVFVRKLRQKLEKASPDWTYIHTHFGVGYRFAAELREDAVLDVPSAPPADLAPAPSSLRPGLAGSSPCGRRPHGTARLAAALPNSWYAAVSAARRWPASTRKRSVRGASTIVSGSSHRPSTSTVYVVRAFWVSMAGSSLCRWPRCPWPCGASRGVVVRRSVERARRRYAVRT